MALGQEFYRNSYRTVINVIEQRDPASGYKDRLKDASGRPLSRYVVNKDEGNFKKVKVTRSFLRLEILLQPNLTNYPFALLTNVAANNGPTVQGTQPTETRLKIQDVFFCNRIGFYIYMKTSPGGSTGYQFLLFTCPTSTFLAGGINPIMMMGIWTGATMTVTVNNDVLTPAWDMLQHLYIPQMQGDPSGGIGPAWEYFNPGRYNEDGIIVVEPMWVINGGNDNEYTISYPYSLATMGITGSVVQIFLVLKLEGFLAQNCSSIMDNQSKN